MIKGVLSKLTSSNYFKSVAKLAGGTSIAHLITVLISPLLARLFPVTSFGELQLFHSMIIIGSIIITGTYEFAIIIPKKRKYAFSLFFIAFSSASILSLSLYIPILLFNDFFSQILKLTNLFLLAYPITLLTNSAINIFQYWYLRFEKYNLLSSAKITQSSTIAASQFFIGFQGFLTTGLIFGYFFGRFITLLAFVFNAGLSFWNDFKKLKFRKLRKTAHLYKNQPKFTVFSSLLSSGGIEFPILLIGSLFGQIELGFYALAYRVLSAPSALLGTSVGQVFYKKAAERISQNVYMKFFLLKTWVGLFVISIVPMITLYLYAEPIFGFIFSDKWISAGTVASILAPLLFIDFISAPTGKTLILLRKEKTMTLFSSLIFSVRIIGILIGFYFYDFFIGLKILVLLHIFVLICYNVFLYTCILKYDQSLKT